MAQIDQGFYSFTETIHVVYGLIMINQYHLMSHMSVHQHKLDRFVLGTTSKYITNYIEQRKVLILAKLARNNHQSDKIPDETIQYTKNTHMQYHDKVGFKQEGNRQRQGRATEVFEYQRLNKINKNGHFHSNRGKDKFLFRSSLYQKQKHLSFQLQKRKSLCAQASSLRFQPELKKDQSSLSKPTERKRQRQQELYQLKHDKKYCIKQEEPSRICYKDLIRQSMTKFDDTKQSPTIGNNQKERWKKIQQIFEQIKPIAIEAVPPPKVEEQNIINQNNEEKLLKEEDIIKLQVNQLKLTLQKVESEEESVNVLMYNIQMEQHFQQDLSGILMDDDQKQQVDSSHVFQNVVKEMMLENQVIIPEAPMPTCNEQIQIAHCTSILAPAEEQQEGIIVGGGRDYGMAQVGEDEWIKAYDEQSNNEHIEIKKVESQIIQSSQVQPLQKFQQLIESKVEQLIDHQEQALEQHNSGHNSLIDKLSDQMMVEQIQKVQVVSSHSRQDNKIQKQSLQTLANQFIFLIPVTKNNEQDDDLSIPDQESPSISMEFFNFNALSHQITANIINNVSPLQKVQVKDDYDQPLQNEHNQYQPQNEETTEEVYEQQEVYQEQKISSTTRILLSLGEFLMIPEQSEQQSHQSIE